MHKNKNRDSQIIRKLFISLLPIQALSVGLPAINRLIDSMIVGNTQGTVALAAVGFVAPLTWIISTISSLLSSGSQLLSGQRLGKGDTEGILKIFNTTIFVSVLAGLLVLATAEIFPEQIAVLLGASGECLYLTSDYIKGYAIGFVFMILSTSLLTFLQLDGAGKISTISVVSMLVVNTTLNLANAFVFHLGLFGVGLSTSLGNIVSVLIAFFYFPLRSKLFKFSFKQVHFKTLKEIAVLGMPAAVSPVCNMLRDRVVNAVVFSLAGTIGMSAMTIAGNLNAAVGCLAEAGYSGSGRIISSILVGQRDRKSLRELPKVMTTSAWYIFIIAYAIVFIFAKPLALLFGADPAYMTTYLMVIRLFNLWYITSIIKTPPLCIYQGMGKVFLLNVFTILNVVVFPVFVCIFLKDVFGLAVIASVPWIGELLLCIIYVIYYTIKAKELPKSPLKMAYIPESVGAPKELCLNQTITNIDEAVLASKRAVEFCEANNISSKETLFCGLCIEEMAADTILNRFSGDGKNAIDLRMNCEDNKLTIMLRDDCETFDPSKWLELYAHEDPSRSIGLKMVSDISEEMNYTNVLGLNVLYIRLGW